MRDYLLQLDRLLRGEVTRPNELRDGQISIDLRGLALIVLLLGAVYGLCMGSYSLLKSVPDSILTDDPYGRYKQLFATIIKVPALFYLTLLVTFPSLYVFNALVGSRLTIRSVLNLLIASLAINLAVLASLGPIVFFFSASTKSYAFIQLLNVTVFTVSGVLGLTFLLQTLHRMTTSLAQSREATELGKQLVPVADAETFAAEALAPEAQRPDIAIDRDTSALDMPDGETLERHTRLVFGIWVCVFAFVGAQMGWVLRPFIGSPGIPFTFFRERSSNFFEAVLRALGALLGITG